MTESKKPRTPPRWFVKSFWYGHRAVHRVSGGRLGLRPDGPGRWGMFKLETTGRRSGQTRVAILGYITDGDDIVTIATNGMAEAPPAWWLNLQAQPDAVAVLPGERRLVRAHEATGEERARLWGAWLEIGPELADDAAALQRELPMVVLERREEVAAGAS